jgi:ankyrin repeat protein
MKKGIFVVSILLLFAGCLVVMYPEVCRANTFFDFEYQLSENNIKAIESMIAKGNVNAKNNQGVTVLMAAILKNNVQVAQMLVDKGADVSAKTEAGLTPLMFAASVGNPAMVKLLLAKGADAAVKDQLGKTASDYAKEKGFVEVADLLEKK